MERTLIERKVQFEHGILFVFFLLLGLGAVLVYSATVYPASIPADKLTAGDGMYFLKKHLFSIGVGLVGAAVMIYVPFDWFRKAALPVLLLGLAAMILVLFVGEERLGAVRWFRLGPFWLQPGEVVKLAFVLWLSWSLTRKSETIRRFTIGVLPHLLAALVLALLYVVQPDLGSAVILGAVMLILLYIAGTKWQYIASIVLTGGLGTAALILTSEERMGRVRAWLNPELYARTEGYQLVNAEASIGSGGLWGQGLGSGYQNVAGFVPEAETDFIFAVLGEELGLVGCVLVILAFAYILWRSLVLAARVKDQFARYLTVGSGLLISLQAAINIGVATGLLPTKGLTAPGLSFGGSSMVVTCACVGILLNVSRTQPVLTRVEEGTTAQEESMVFVREGA